MGSIWLRDLHTVLAGTPHGLRTVPGWETRSRSSGGYDSLEGVVIHHTAEGLSSDGWPSVNHQCFQDAERPNAALHTDRQGILYIMAAGACNTQGKGGPVLGVPQDQGNMRLIGYELGNNGIGEPYPVKLQETVLWVTTRLYEVYGVQQRGWNKNAERVHHHRTYAPGRKCDPTGPSRWTTDNNAGCGGADAWELSLYRAAVASALLGQPPPPPQGDEEMAEWFVKDGTNEWIVGGLKKRRLNPAHTAANGWQRSLHSLAKSFIDIPLGTAAQQATWRQWVASIPDDDSTADDAPMGVILAAVNTRAATTHLQEVENKVDAIPTTGGGTGGGGGGATEAQVRLAVREELDASEIKSVPGHITPIP